MRTALRLLICALMSSSIVLAPVPARAVTVQAEKSDCCAKMKPDDASRHCERHKPTSDREQQCCAACSFGLALLLTPAQPFVYPAVGEQTFAVFVVEGASRSERPAVPPPRA